MLSTLMKRMFGSRNDRTLRRMEKTVLAINALEPQMKALTDAQLSEKTPELKARHQAGESMDALLPEAFAQACAGVSLIISFLSFSYTVLFDVVSMPVGHIIFIHRNSL